MRDSYGIFILAAGLFAVILWADYRRGERVAGITVTASVGLILMCLYTWIALTDG